MIFSFHIKMITYLKKNDLVDGSMENDYKKNSSFLKLKTYQNKRSH